MRETVVESEAGESISTAQDLEAAGNTKSATELNRQEETKDIEEERISPSVSPKKSRAQKTNHLQVVSSTLRRMDTALHYRKEDRKRITWSFYMLLSVVHKGQRR